MLSLWVSQWDRFHSVCFIKPTKHFMRKSSLSAETNIQKLNIEFNLAGLWDTVNESSILSLCTDLFRGPGALFNTGRTVSWELGV